MVVMKSRGWCCEFCGTLIIGNCNNDNGFVSHIDSCITEGKKRMKINGKH